MATPLLLSIQVGLPKRRGIVGSMNPLDRPFQSGIFKDIVEGRVWLGEENLAGDGQADLENHGGPYRAVLGYSAEHYAVWRAELAMPDLPYGAFGENFTISGLDEETVCIGDIFSIGEVKVQVSQPRQPCWKLARRWNMKDLTARVHDHGWGGWYMRVLQQGYVEAETSVVLEKRPMPGFDIAFVYALMSKQIEDPQAMTELADCEWLSPGWREVFAERAGQ